jgi:hypothetical protein
LFNRSTLIYVDLYKRCTQKHETDHPIRTTKTNIIVAIGLTFEYELSLVLGDIELEEEVADDRPQVL